MRLFRVIWHPDLWNSKKIDEKTSRVACFCANLKFFLFLSSYYFLFHRERLWCDFLFYPHILSSMRQKIRHPVSHRRFFFIVRDERKTENCQSHRRVFSMNPIPSSSIKPSQRFHVERSNQFLFLVTHSHGKETISTKVSDCHLETAIKEAYRKNRIFLWWRRGVKLQGLVGL